MPWQWGIAEYIIYMYILYKKTLSKAHTAELEISNSYQLYMEHICFMFWLIA